MLLKVLRAGLAAVLLTLAVVVGLVVNSPGAEALTTFPNPAPPRIPTVPGSTRVSPITPNTPSIPSGIFTATASGASTGAAADPLHDFWNWATSPDWGYMEFWHVPDCSQSGACNVFEQQVYDARQQQGYDPQTGRPKDTTTATTGPQNVQPASDGQWCQALLICSSLSAQTLLGAPKPDVPMGNIGKTTVAVAAFKAPNVLTLTASWQMNTSGYCSTSTSQATAACQLGPSKNGYPIYGVGQCKNLTDGTLKGIGVNSPAGSTGSTESTNPFGAEPAQNGASPLDVQVCPNNYGLLWLRWYNPPVTGTPSLSVNNGTYVAPDYNADQYKDVQFQSKLTCGQQQPDGSITYFTQTQTSAKGSAYIPQLTCPVGWQVDNGETDAITSFLQNPVPLRTFTLPAEKRTQYSECIGWQVTTPCILRIQIDGTDCTNLRPECYDWYTLWRSSPSRVKCMWGPYELDISQCQGPLRNMYVGETGVMEAPGTYSPNAVDPNGNPLTNNNPQPNPSASPGTDPYANTTPGTSAIPGTGTNPGYSTPGQTQANGVPDPSTTPTQDWNNCMGGAWSWNPVEWVMKPVICAGKVLFIPKQDIQAEMNSAGDNIKSKAPFTWIVSGTALVNAGANMGGSGCPNWVVTVGGQSWNIVCGNSFTDAILAQRGTIFSGMTVAMFWPFFRALWYATIPLIPVRAKD